MLMWHVYVLFLLCLRVCALCLSSSRVISREFLVVERRRIDDRRCCMPYRGRHVAGPRIATHVTAHPDPPTDQALPVAGWGGVCFQVTWRWWTTESGRRQLVQEKPNNRCCRQRQRYKPPGFNDNPKRESHPFAESKICHHRNKWLRYTKSRTASNNSSNNSNTVCSILYF